MDYKKMKEKVADAADVLNNGLKVDNPECEDENNAMEAAIAMMSAGIQTLVDIAKSLNKANELKATEIRNNARSL